MKRCLILLVAAAAVCLVACARPAPAGPLVEYHRTGGIAGFDDHLVIQADRSAVLTRRTGSTRFTLDRGGLDRLNALFDQAGFSRLDREYLPDGQGADLFDYRITYRGHTVHTMDTAVPAALQPVLDHLNGLVQTHGKP